MDTHTSSQTEKVSLTAALAGWIPVAQKNNGIPAAQDMIAALSLTGRLFTLDAMHCQKNIPDYA